MRRLVVTLALAASCATAPPAPDATPDVSPDVSPDATPDVTSTLDATPTPDVVTDIAVDATPDIAADASAPPDAAPAADTLTLVLFRAPDNTPAGAAIHVAGTFNGWAPDDPRTRLTPGPNSTLSVRVAGLTAGQRVEFKFTRGSWATVERADGGADITNRVVTFDPAHPIAALFVERWADLGAPATTRSGAVRVLRDVAVPQLARTRNVWVYLPPGHDTSGARYPVTYMFDGQNLFDARASAFGREWRVDEALEALYYEGDLPGVIVVGVENSSSRGCEYNVFASDPHPACSAGSALGDQTIAFFVDTLKPRVDGEFRTLTAAESTAVAGSSMGGSMAVRAGFSRPDVFSRVAALSPSYQNTLAAAPAMPAYVRAPRAARPQRLYQDIGGAEQIREIGPAVLARNMMAVRDAARDAGLTDGAQRALVIDGATHDEGAWAARIRGVLRWLWAP